MQPADAPRATTTVVLKRHDNKQVEFDIGKAALQLDTSVRAADYWIADLYTSGGIMTLCGVAACVLGAYTTASVDAGAWPIVTLQACFVALAAAWWFAAWWRSARVLTAVLYVSVPSTLVAAGALALWTTIYLDIRGLTAWLWWTLGAIQLVQVMAAISAMIALANLYACRLHYEAAMTFNASMSQQVEAQSRRGDMGDGKTEARMGSGAVALAATAAATAAPDSGGGGGKKKIV